MPNNKPTPPPGYTLDDLPPFERESAVGTKMVNAPPMAIGQGRVVADVDPANPKTIEVREPSLYDKPTNTHEFTHVFQLSRNPAFASMRGQQQATTPADYDYGGVDGLLQAQLQRKTISSFTPEQQANMVADYQRETQDAIAKGDRVKLAKLNAAYGLYVRQLSNIPGKDANMTQMTQQDLTPPAPGPPASTVAGMPLVPDKTIGTLPAPRAKHPTDVYQDMEP